MPDARTIWKRVALTGSVITFAGAVAVGLSFSQVEFFEKFDEDIFLPFMVGLFSLLIGLIGWAAQLGRAARARMAGLTLLPPALVVVIGIFTNPNVHGIFALAGLASIPLFAVGIILGIMALASRRP